MKPLRPQKNEGIIQYFRMLTELEPTKDQARILKTAIKQNRIIISAGRQSGKTMVVAVLVMWFMFKHNMTLRILLVSAQDNIVYYYVKNFFKNNPDLLLTVTSKGRTYAVPAYGFATDRGSELFVTGPTERNIRGKPADIVIIDEACSIFDESIMTAMGNISGPISKFILLSTPHHYEKPFSLFSKWLQDPKLHKFKTFTWSCEGLSWHGKEMLKMKKIEFSPAKYAIEVLGRLPTKEELALSGDIMGMAIFGQVPKRTYENLI